jgi:hypothetical protein
MTRPENAAEITGADALSAQGSGWLDATIELNRKAVIEYIATASEMRSSQWVRPCGLGKWSPAQITEYLAITYEHGARFLDGKTDILGPKPPRLLRPLLRTFMRLTYFGRGSFLRAERPQDSSRHRTRRLSRSCAFGFNVRASRSNKRHARELAPKLASSSTRTSGLSRSENSCDFKPATRPPSAAG